MIIRIFSKEFYVRVGSPFWWAIAFLFCGGAFYMFMKILWMVG